jgi:hypothetical protein
LPPRDGVTQFSAAKTAPRKIFFLRRRMRGEIFGQRLGG